MENFCVKGIYNPYVCFLRRQHTKNLPIEFLLKYRAGLCKIDVREQSKKMFDEITVRDLIKVESVGDVKNYSLLEYMSRI